MSDKKNVFFVGLDPFNLETLKGLPQASECNFLSALDFDEMRDDGGVSDIQALVDKSIARMEAVEGGPDGVASFYDFPGTIIASILAQHFGLPGPSLESLLKCEHKYWSRLEQQKVVDEYIPTFRAFDPTDPDAFSKLGLIPPFWIKPIKSFRSYLAYQIQDERSFIDLMPHCAEAVGPIVNPFMEIMQRHDMPPEMANMPESFIAESTIGGAQCTLEGYSYDGRVVIYGVVDSIREADSSSFARYEYPSTLPLEIQHRMMDVARASIQQFGYDNGPFNAEFFYDQTSDVVWLLEINPRASQSHADLFYKVHGVSHMSVVVDLALGRKPRPFGRRGEWNTASHFFVRAFEPGIVTQVPTVNALDRLKRRMADLRVKIEVAKGTDLGGLPNQDSYSFELANVYLGGRDRMDILDKYDQVLTALQFEVESSNRVGQ